MIAVSHPADRHRLTPVAGSSRPANTFPERGQPCPPVPNRSPATSRFGDWRSGSWTVTNSTFGRTSGPGTARRGIVAGSAGFRPGTETNLHQNAPDRRAALRWLPQLAMIIVVIISLGFAAGSGGHTGFSAKTRCPSTRKDSLINCQWTRMNTNPIFARLPFVSLGVHSWF